MSIKFTRQPDGTYIESGDLPLGTRTVQVYIDGVARMKHTEPAKEYLVRIRKMVASPGSCRAQQYEVRPVGVDAPELIAKRVSQLEKARQKKQTGETDESPEKYF